jgi:predicted AlkP superfamily phosphohydrolase/phosphomutase
LFLREGASPAEPYLRAVDWSRTRAYTFGLTGIYLNVKGREAEGVVARGEEEAAVKREIAEKLTGLPDEERGATAIVKAYVNDEIYKGPYMGASPDIVIGYNNGYRSSWDAALGRVGEAVFEDNRKAWSGDHCVDPSLVPGVIFSNWKFASEDPGIEDLAPTTLRLFGFDPPAYMDGKDLGVKLNGKTTG